MLSGSIWKSTCFQTDYYRSMQNFLKKYDHIPHNEKSIKLLLAEEKFLKIKQVVEEEQTQPEFLRVLLQSLLEDLQILNEIQPLKQEILIKFRKIKKRRVLWKLRAEGENQKEDNRFDYRENREDKLIAEGKFNGLSIEIRKITQEAKELRESEARARNQKIIIDDDDDDLGFYAVHPNTIHIPVSQSVEPRSLKWETGILTHPKRRLLCEPLFSNPSEFDDFSLGECNLFDIDDSYYEKSTSRLAHLAPISPEIVEVCVDNDDTDDDDDCDMPVFEEEIQKDEFNSFSNPLYDIDDEIITNESYSLSRKDLDEIILIPPGIDEPCFNAESDLLESLLNHQKSENVDTIIEVSLLFSDPLILGVHDNEEEEIAFLDGLLEDENFFEINDKKVESLEKKTKEDFETKDESKSKKELQVVHPDIKILNHFETTSFVGSDYVFYEDFNLMDMIFPMNIQGKIFDPGITFHEKPFEKDAFKDKSSNKLATSKALLTFNALDVFDPLHPPLMDFHVTKAFSGFTISLLKIFSK
ncbi:hypothetical protein Tco_0637589 [Tanacetum coccineum]